MLLYRKLTMLWRREVINAVLFNAENGVSGACSFIS